MPSSGKLMELAIQWHIYFLVLQQTRLELGHQHLLNFSEHYISTVCKVQDKDWAQINAARQTWPTTKIQLCYWHLRRAVKKRLADSSVNTSIYDAKYANREVNLIDVNFQILVGPINKFIITISTCINSNSDYNSEIGMVILIKKLCL